MNRHQPLDFEKEAQRAATLRFSPFSWCRGPARYDRQGDLIVIEKSRSEQYFPADEPNILRHLAAITGPPEAVAFAQRFGLLTKGPDEGLLAERFDEIREEAEFLWLYLRLYEVIARAQRGDLNAPRELRTLWYQRLQESAAALDLTSEAPTDDDALAEWSMAFLAGVVNQGMRGAEYAVAADWSLSVWPEDLLSYAYFELSLIMNNKKPVLVCAECGLVFIVEHGRQRFCSSTCSTRSRNRRWRRSKRGDDE